MSKKPTWNDIINERPSELMRHYKISETDLGKVVRSHSHGIKTAKERRDFYETVYDNRNKR